MLTDVSDARRTLSRRASENPNRPRKRRRGGRRAHFAEALFVLPLILLIGLGIAFPALTAVFRSFFDWSPGYESTFVGLENYRDIAESDLTRQIFRNSGVFLLAVPLWTVIPLAVTLLLYDRVPGAGVFRTVFFFPAILSPAILGVLLRTILEPDGMLNAMLRSVGLGALTQQWIDNPGLVKPTLIAVLAWAGMGLGVLLFSAGLSAIPPELFEAAELDGANWWQRLRYVMVPGIRNLVLGWVVWQIITVFLGLFGWIYVLTQGGPEFASTTLDYDIYNQALSYGAYGYAAAEGVLLIALVLSIVVLVYVLRRMRAPKVVVRATNKMGQALESLQHLRRRIMPGSGRPSAAKRRKRFFRRSRRRNSWSVWRTGMVSLVALAYVYPFIFVVGTVLKPAADFSADRIGLPRRFTLEHLRYAWETAGLGRGMLNSVIATAVGVCVGLIVSMGAAFWFSRHSGKGARLLLASILGIWIFPLIVYIVPLFVYAGQLNLTNNLVILGVAYATVTVPYGVYLLTTHLRDGIPKDVTEAAEVDGATVFQVFRWIIVPLARPMLATVASLFFIGMWGDLLLSIILVSDPNLFTATVAASTLPQRYDPRIQASAAAGLIAVLPTLVVFLFAQRAIQRGFTAGISK